VDIFVDEKVVALFPGDRVTETPFEKKDVFPFLASPGVHRSSNSLSFLYFPLLFFFISVSRGSLQLDNNYKLSVDFKIKPVVIF
jgi:hypothetical protein